MPREKYPGIGPRIMLRMRALGYWRRREHRPDVQRFAEDKGYNPAFLYAWLRDRMPGPRHLHRLSYDLEVPQAWILLGDDAVDEVLKAHEKGTLPTPARKRHR
jgi:hypothetical protein